MNHAVTGIAASALLVAACGTSEKSSFDESQQQAVALEIHQRLDEYSDAVTRRDLDAILSFWSDSGELVFAGDGAILGGYDEWATIARRDNEHVDHWIHWTWNNVHVLPLSRNSASATLEFNYEKVLLSGENVKGYGSWTYVFRRTPDGWKVFHSNGHHPVR